MSTLAGWTRSLGVLAIGRAPRSAEDLLTLARLLQAATPDAEDAVIERAVGILALHYRGEFLPTPPVILGAVREYLQPLDLAAVFTRIRRHYRRQELSLTPATIDRLFPESELAAAVKAMADTVGADQLLDHALDGQMHPASLYRAREAAQLAVSKHDAERPLSHPTLPADVPTPTLKQLK